MTQRQKQFSVWLSCATLTAFVVMGAALYRYLPRRGEAAAAKRAEGAKKPGLTMAESERKLLWEIEHNGLVLGQTGFRAIVKALLDQEPAAFERLLADGFEAEFPATASEIRVETKFATVARRERGEPQRITPAAFVAELFKARAKFASKPKIKIALMGLSPVVRDRLEGPWRGSCQFRMWGETKEGKPAEVLAYWSYEIAKPSESSLAQGKWFKSCKVTRWQWSESPKKLFRQVAKERGFVVDALQDNWESDNMIPITGGAYCCDYNRDGCIDVLVVDVRGVWLYQGRTDGTFREVNEIVGLPEPGPDNMSDHSITAAFADLDNDGWEDLIVGHRIYRNVEGKHFVDQTHRSNLRISKKAIGFVVADYDGDGLIDVYLLNEGTTKTDSWIEGRTGLSEGNHLWRNLGNWKFEDTTKATGTDGGGRSIFTAAWLDADDDGRPDLYLINEFGNGVLLVNQKDQHFRQVSLFDGPSDFGTMGVVAGDIDNDGKTDLYLANMYSKAGNRIINNLREDAYPPEVMGRMRRFATGSQLYHNRGGLKFDRIGEALHINDVGWAYGPALIDLDNDGYEDIYAACGFISQSRDDPDG